MNVLLGVTGCIGAYKSAEILRLLQKSGVKVRVVMTRSATEFIQPLTFESLSGQSVIVEMYDRPSSSVIEHIALAREAELLLIAPATANILAKFAHGIADDFLSTLYLSNINPVLIAPAMNVEMWSHPATQNNLKILRERGNLFVEPGSGYQACGEVGVGRLAEPEEIVARALEILRTSHSTLRTDLAGENIVITAGPTVEDIDPVRFITNRSSGKMGYALAEAAQLRGAEVTLISGPTKLSAPAEVEIIPVRSTREMSDAVLRRVNESTVFIGCAAVADYRPAVRAEQKIKKNGQPAMTLELEATEDIIATVGALSNDQNRIVIGFAAESESLLSNAEKKLNSKNLDLIVANDITRTDAGFDVETNAATILRRDGTRHETALMSKHDLANTILDEVIRLRTG